MKDWRAQFKHRATYKHGDLEIQIAAERFPRITKKTRYYVSGEEDVDFSDLMVTEGWANDPALTPAFNKRNRKVVANKRAVLLDGMRVLLEECPGAVSKETVFSRTAGCSCGCSPGFVGETCTITVKGERYYVTDVWVTKH